MGKRAPIGETPYRPLLDAEALSGALKMATPGAGTQPAMPPRIESTGKPVGLLKESVPPEMNTARAGIKPLSIAAVELVEKLDQEKRVLMTRGEAMALERLVAAVAERLKTQVKASHVLRAAVTLVLNAEGQIDRRAGDVAGVSRPANGNSKALQAFEKEIAKIIGAAIRDAGPLR